jgi:hypothetical protein
MLTPEMALTCPGCGIDTSEGMDPMYATAFVPGTGRFDFEWPTCGSCAVAYRIAAQERAEHLENRQEQFGGQSSGPQTTYRPSGIETWSGLGLDPARYKS